MVVAIDVTLQDRCELGISPANERSNRKQNNSHTDSTEQRDASHDSNGQAVESRYRQCETKGIATRRTGTAVQPDSRRSTRAVFFALLPR